MWKPLQLKIVNFGAIKSVHYRFGNGEARLIQGKNEDDEGQQSNGAGKSLPLDAISVCLLGEPLRKLRLVELIRDTCDYSDLEFDLYNTLQNKFFRISIKIHLLKSQTINLWICDKEEELGNKEFELKLSGVEEKKKRILEEIGISKEDLLNYYLVHKDTYSSFFSSSDTKKKEVVNRFSGGYLIDGVEKEVESEIKENEAIIKAKENLIQFISGKQSVLNDSILELETLNEDELKLKDIEVQNNLIARSNDSIFAFNLFISINKG